MLTVVYMAHPVSDGVYTFSQNIGNALNWERFLKHLKLEELNKLLGLDRNPERKVVEVAKREGSGEKSHLLVNPFEELPVIIAPWLVNPMEDSRTVGGRSKVLRDCSEVVKRCDELWHVGGIISPGMIKEAHSSKKVRDLTHWGRLPPLELIVGD